MYVHRNLKKPECNHNVYVINCKQCNEFINLKASLNVPTIYDKFGKNLVVVDIVRPEVKTLKRIA